MAACASAGSGADPADAPPAPVDGPRSDAPVDLCPSAVTCQTAALLGQVSGDTGNQKLTAMGYQAAWFRVRVTEDNNGIVGLTLRGAAKLTSPAGVDFDVFVYLDTGSDVIACTTPTGTMTTAGGVEQTRVEWGEGSIPNGIDDDRTLSIEVRPISGACAPGQPWQLEIEGNWPN